MRGTKFAILAVVSGIAVAGFLSALQTHPLSKAGEGDWAQYAVTVDNSTTPFLGVKDQKRWRVVQNVDDNAIVIANYTKMNGERSTMAPVAVAFDKPFEPVFEIAQGAKIEVVSSGPESLTVKGKSCACTKTVRKVTRPSNAETMQPAWNGTSTIWTSPDVPLGIVKIENQSEAELLPGSPADKIKETWTLVDFGFKNWQD
jgi:hypothetical protein